MKKLIFWLFIAAYQLYEIHYFKRTEPITDLLLIMGRWFIFYLCLFFAYVNTEKNDN